MHFIKKDPIQKKAEFAKKLKSGKLLRFPGAYNPLVAKLIEKLDMMAFMFLVASWLMTWAFLILV